jgi:hypothetical protein
MWHGQVVEVNKVMKRKYSNNKGFWEAEEIESKTGLFLGFRYLRNGFMKWSEYYGSKFVPTETVKVCLVSFDAIANPVYAPVDEVHPLYT